jgi:hypothetical protein
MGRVADGASGMSSGFCCAPTATASKKTNAKAINPLVFFAIPESHAFLSKVGPAVHKTCVC